MARINFPTGEVVKEFVLDTEMITPPKIKLKIKPSLKREASLSFMKRVNFTKEQFEEIGSEDIKNADKEKIIKEKIMEAVVSENLVDKFDFAVEHAMSLVTGWDLESGAGDSIPCNAENKERYLKPLMWEHVVEEKTEDEKEEKKKSIPFLYFKVVKFASDINNFSKN